MLDLFFTNPYFFLVWAGALLVAITIHEFAHAYMADRLGDPTPRLQGRLTLNPIAHLDPLGTIMLLLFRFGWGKPVQFDPYNLKNPRRDSALISFAGPFSNILLATLLAILYRIVAMPFSPFFAISNLIPPFIFLNVALAIFNLIPIHPLDGGKILVGLLPHKEAVSLDHFLQKYGLLILLFLVFPVWGGVSPVWAIINPIMNILLSIYLPNNLIV